MILDSVKIIYILLSLFIISVLVYFIRLVFNKAGAIKKDANRIMIIAIIAIIFYTIFSISDNYILAKIMCSCYFICTDLMVYSMINYSINYTGFVQNKALSLFKKICICLIILDGASLLLNTFTEHSFDIQQAVAFTGVVYWLMLFTPLHYIHLDFCYVMVASSLLLLFKAFFNVASLYKQKYLTVIVAYLVVIFVNMFCYTAGTVIDFSVWLYALLAGFISYYSIFTFPESLVIKLLNRVNESIKEIIICFDLDGNCIYHNKAALTLFSSREHFDREKCQAFYKSWQQQNGTYSCAIDGGSRYYIVEKNVLQYSNVRIGDYFLLTDKTQEINALKREQYNFTHDEVTGLLNREGFFKNVDEVFSKYNDQQWMMVCTNIQDFKMINEIFGTETGDRILKKEAELLKRYAHKDSVYGRIADDKFCIFFRKEYFSEDVVKQYYDQIKKIISSQSYELHMQFGIYEIKSADESADSMFDKAMFAMDEIHGNYMKLISYFDSNLMDKRLSEKNIIADFDEAISKEEFELYLQPLITNNNKSFGAEVLVRWNHPERGIIVPDFFVKVYEQCGLISRLDLYIWRKACAILKDWKSRGLTEPYLCVNVSPWDLYYFDLYAVFTGLVSEFGIDPGHLNIELTETVLLSDYKKVMELFKKLQDFGFKIEIDDFGSGYSSLNMLKDIKADILKIDMLFLNKTVNFEKSRKILAAIITLAKKLNMNVITEGVENESQVKMLSDLGCNTFQGYYFSKPLSVTEFEKKYF
ncbi:GGDEF and EAL domain-containing protein [Treponema sp.]|uniref:GGDEF and EAL domain-containing protein n=1 Tax=Treponema sp. TaxID=166 RepID=UPI0025F33FDA|nr:GGDEF and EAL domain-containing protein [Treponema sp.]MCR5217314.1 EAL domain-containing protein [Treponema sp.]